MGWAGRLSCPGAVELRPRVVVELDAATAGVTGAGVAACCDVPAGGRVTVVVGSAPPAVWELFATAAVLLADSLTGTREDRGDVVVCVGTG